MFAAFVEAVRSLVQPCSLVVIVPPVCAVLAGRGRRHVVVGTVVGGVLGGWTFAAGRLVLDPTGLRLSALVLMTAMAILLLGTWERLPAALAGPPAHSLAAASVAFVAVLWWRPCVGSQLGRILTGFPEEPLRHVLPASAYMLGLMVPAIVAGLALDLGRQRPSIGRGAAGAGSFVVGILGLAVLAGRHGDLVSELVHLTEG